MKQEPIHIRKGEAHDIDALHRLIRELAIYEKAEDKVETTPEIMLQDGFGKSPLFEFFVAETEGREIVGIALFYFGYSTWRGKMMYLDDLVVTSSHRRKGIGYQLFDALIRYAKANEAKQLRWHVLDWNEPAIAFYEKLEATLDPEWITCWLNREQILTY